MKKMIIAFILTVLCIGEVSAEEFVDKRFSRVLIPFFRDEFALSLSPTQIKFLHEKRNLYKECQLLENKTAYLKFGCGKMHGLEDEVDNRITGYIEFSIIPSYHEECTYMVERLSYVLPEYREDFGYEVNYCPEE